MLNETIVSLQEMKLSPSKGLYAILDVCDAPEISERIKALSKDQVVCLYRGKTDSEILADAPFLALVDESLLEWLSRSLWNTPWGVFLLASASLKDLRKHLRKFLIVRDPEGDLVYFRYYDPRLLPTFLASCNENELEAFFGPVYGFGVSVPQKKDISFLCRQR